MSQRNVRYFCYSFTLCRHQGETEQKLASKTTFLSLFLPDVCVVDYETWKGN